MHGNCEEIITSASRLRELYQQPTHRGRNKVIDHIDDICRRFINACPFAVLASTGTDGRLDVSPKGDPAGFVVVLNPKTLAIPDRPGNNRLDTYENLLANPAVGLLFMIPGHGDTLRVSGKGRIVRDTALQQRFAVSGRPPATVLLVAVEQAFMHCPKSVIRSGLWAPSRWPNRADVPFLAEAIVAHAKPHESADEVKAIVDRANEHLY
jgi:PPOX class probable FMN-dependent enzyme